MRFRFNRLFQTLASMMMTVVTLPLAGQVGTTQIADTIYRADGTLATGTVIVSWQGFTTAGGQVVPAGSTSASINAGGILSLQLVSNVGASPIGSFYTAVYHLDNGSVSREYWVVPASQNVVTVGAIRSAVLPASVAMQTVSKSYVDTQIASALSGGASSGSGLAYVAKGGDTMGGPLALAADPISASQAANKHYVDTAVGAVNSGLTQKVSLAPQGSQAIAQPSGTQMQTNLLNGVEYASQFTSGLGGNGIANATGAADCASGCEVKAEQSYGASEGYTPASWNSGPTSGTHLEDHRGGQRHDSYFNPYGTTNPGTDAGQVISVVSTRSASSVASVTHAQEPSSLGLLISHAGLTGGSNVFPASIESVPYFKSTYAALSVAGTYNTQGQHVLAPHDIDCFGVGDCLIGSQFLRASGGFRDEADEGAHPFDLQIQEDTRVFQGNCSTGCTSGSTTIGVAVTSAYGTQGEGRYLINKNPAKEITSGTLTGGAIAVSGSPGPTASFTGTSFPVSVFLATAQVVSSQATNVAPGLVNVAIATTGVSSGFAKSTASLPNTSGVACVADVPNAFNPTNYEMAPYSVVDGTHLQMTLNKVHAAGATIAVGGLCGFGAEQTVDTLNGIRQVFPVIGSYSATGFYYAAHETPILGISGLTSSYLNVSRQIASITRSSGTVNVTSTGSMPVDLNGLKLTVSSVTDASFNGTFTVTSTGANTLTYTQAGADSASSGGTIGILTGGYVLYPMAEVLGVFNATTKSVDGQLTLAANTVAWSANDPVEEPHYFQEAVQADTEFVGQTIPRATVYARAGLQYQTNVGPGLRGWTVQNAAPVSNYFGNGGTHSAPDVALETSGVWNRTLEAQAGEIGVFQIHCNSHGCGRWNSGYNLFELDSASGQDQVSFQPSSDALNITMRGLNYSFTPTTFSAPSISVGNLNVTTLGVTSNTTAAQTMAFMAPHLNLNSQFCQGFGTSLAAHSSTFYCWWNKPTPYASLETYAGGDPLQIQASSIWLNGGAVAIGNAATIGSSLPALLNVGSNAQFQVDATGNVTAANFAGILSGTTGTIGGTALAGGSCTSGSVAVTNARVGAPVAVSASDGTLPNALSILSAAVSAAGSVTVQVCAVGPITPAAKTYNVRVMQ